MTAPSNLEYTPRTWCAVHRDHVMQNAHGASKGIDHEQATYVISQGTFAVQLKRGQLIPLKTKLETQTSNRTVDAHVVEIPTKSANTILR